MITVRFRSEITQMYSILKIEKTQIAVKGKNLGSTCRSLDEQITLKFYYQGTWTCTCTYASRKKN
jgi:hypothetical protein